jgi:NADP-dependent 3-hydroxy acid dehydrogenase YdfG
MFSATYGHRAPLCYDARPSMTPKTVFLTGASSGIGRALALAYAKKGVRVALVARRKAELEGVAAEIRALGGMAVPIVADVAKVHDIEEALREANDALGGLDMVIANAGVGSPKHATRLTVAEVVKVVDVNVRGAFVTLVAALPYLLERKRGHLVGVSSLAGRRGLPQTGPYSASKAALTTFLETLRLDLAGSGVRVTDVQPGFVDTEMSRATATRPFLWTAERAASHIVEELRSAPAVVAFPRPLGAAITASRALPDGWVSYLAGKGVGKPR